MADPLASAVAGEGIARQALHGLIRLGRFCIALPAETIREVVPRPEEFLAFPSPIPEIIGAITLRGQMIPVLDLERMLAPAGADGPRSAGSIVAVIRHGDLVHGIIADGIDGVASLHESATGRLEHPGSAGDNDLVRATFVHSNRAGIIIDPAALGAVPGLPMVADKVGQGRAAQKGAEPTLIFRIGGLCCAVPAACVDASLPVQPLAPAPLDDGLWIAMLQHNGFEIPVVDTLALFGQGQVGARASGGAVVLRTRPKPDDAPEGFGLVALLIDSVDDIVRLRPGMIAPLDEELAAVPFGAGVMDLAGGPCLLIDAERLVADERLIRLGGIRQDIAADGPSTSLAVSVKQQSAAAAGATDGGAGTDEREPHLVFMVAGANYAAPLMTIDEILVGNVAMIPLETPRRHVVGLLSHRGCAVPVLDLGGCLGASGRGNAEFLVIARVDRPGLPRRVGFVVDTLRSVEKAVVQTMVDSPRQRTGGPSPLGLLQKTIRLEDGGACGILDLPDLAGSVLNTAADGHGACAPAQEPRAA